MASTAEGRSWSSFLETGVITYTRIKRAARLKQMAVVLRFNLLVMPFARLGHSQECQAESTSATLAGFFYSDYPQATIA